MTSGAASRASRATTRRSTRRCWNRCGRSRRRTGRQPAQIALAWVQQRAQVHGLPVVPIPGTRKRSRLEENTGATRITLTEDELALLEPIAGRVVGDRYPEMTSLSDTRE